jgi:hypothetical protein
MITMGMYVIHAVQIMGIIAVPVKMKYQVLLVINYMDYVLHVLMPYNGI